MSGSPRSPRGLKATLSSTVRRLNAPILFAAWGALLLAACSLDYRSAEQLAEEPAEKVPDTVATDFVYRIVKGSRLSLEVTAGRAESWSAEQRTVLSKATFTELASDGTVATKGSAGDVVFHNDTEDAEVSQGVKVYSASEKASVETASLEWRSKPKLLSAPGEERVTIRKDDGAYIQGSGFTADFRKREVAFSGSVQGKYVRAEEQ